MLLIVDSLFPVFSLLIAGHLLKRYGLTNDVFLRTSDRLIYYIFFPALLFWKIGGAEPATMADFKFCIAVICAITALFLLSLSAIPLFNVTSFQAGTFSQCFYRFNSYIGVAVVLSAFGESGVRYFGILIGFVIPLVNVFSVSVLIWNTEKSVTTEQKLRLTARSLVSNPLILSCIAGILYAKYINVFPGFLDNTLRLSTMVALPLALFSIGGALTAQTLSGNFQLSLVSSLSKLAILPAFGFIFFKLIGVTGMPYQVGMIYLALPTSTAIYVLSSQLASDTQLASASITLSTVLSAASMGAVLWLVV